MVLWIIAAVLLALWILGLAPEVTTGSFPHRGRRGHRPLFILGFLRGHRSAAAP
jgi:hypothetical protein